MKNPSQLQSRNHGRRKLKRKKMPTLSSMKRIKMHQLSLPPRRSPLAARRLSRKRKLTSQTILASHQN